MDSNLVANIEDQIEILTLRIEKLRKSFNQLDSVVMNYFCYLKFYNIESNLRKKITS